MDSGSRGTQLTTSIAHAVLLPAPERLNIHNTMAAELWKEWEKAWMHYARATGLSEKEDTMQVSTLLRVFATFQWEEAADREKNRPVLAKFGAYCKPRKSVYRF